MATHRTTHPQAPKGFFNFSLPFKYKKDLNFWVNRFKEKNIKTKIIRTEEGYILFRENL